MSSILHITGRAALLRRRPLTVAILFALAASAAQAQQGQSMEERLRNQLRITTTQLQDAQNELATLKAGKATPAANAADGKKTAAASPDVESVKKELAEARSQLAAERRTREKSHDATQSALEKANAQSVQYRNAYDELLKLARAAETERQRLAQEDKTQGAAITQCEAKNGELYAVGQEILRAYETMDIGTLMTVRQPFAAQSRVKYEQIAQQYGDKLYEGRFDPRASTTPAATVPTPASAPVQPQ